MCGILGTVNRVFDHHTLDLIKHRGPDSSGIAIENVGSNKVCLGHRRLSIVDLSEAGNQPMISQCRNYSIVFNGEIYNHKELREKLKDVDFEGHSDTETILYYLAHFGMDAISDLNGIYGLAFLDKVSQKLFIARDPNGVKPVYYSSDKDFFLFSSEIRPIIKMIGSHGLSDENLACLLKLRYLPSPSTLFSDVMKLKPGEIVEIDLSNDDLKYSSTTFLRPIPINVKRNKDKAISIYKEKIEEAVERQLMSDVPLGILLSGGIDSAIVAKITREKLGERIKAFTVGFEGNESVDEIRDAEITAELLDLDHYHERINFDKFLEIMEKCCEIVEEPLATTSFIPMYYLSKLASGYVKVVLTGQGADEPLGGYKRYQGEYINHLVPPFLTKSILNSALLFRGKNEKILRAKKALGIQDELKRFENIYAIFSDQEIYDLIGISDRKSINHLKEMSKFLETKRLKTSVERMMGMDVRLNLADDLLIYTDKITMHFALECRVPMLDHLFLEYIESLPLKYRMGLNRSKIIHKAFASEFLPKSIINRPKKGFLSPTKTWFNLHFDKIHDILLSADSHLLDHFNAEAVKKILEEHRKGYNKDKQIFLLLGLYYWIKTNKSILTIPVVNSQ